MARMSSDRPAQAQLSVVRRFEAAGFRAWPAATVHYDGTWAIRLNAGHPAKRVNSVNPLDPGDTTDLGDRIARAGRRFDAYGRPLTFRISPLSGKVISNFMDGENWSRFEESIVMRMMLDAPAVDDAITQIPLRDIGRFVSAAIKVETLDPGLRAGLSEIIGSIEPEAGMFVLESGEQPVTTAICVHDGDLAGLFEVATAKSQRGKGYGRRTIMSALKWARSRGAREAWLQVESANEAARQLYHSLGFAEVYRYHYRRPANA